MFTNPHLFIKAKMQMLLHGSVSTLPKTRRKARRPPNNRGGFTFAF
jgi:hypothetical protein